MPKLKTSNSIKINSQNRQVGDSRFPGQGQGKHRRPEIKYKNNYCSFTYHLVITFSLDNSHLWLICCSLQVPKFLWLKKNVMNHKSLYIAPSKSRLGKVCKVFLTS